MTRIGISVDRWWGNLRADETFRQWADAITPAVARAREMQALNEGLTCWRTENFYPSHIMRRMLPLDEAPTYHKIVHTPPARPEWLEVLA